VPLRVAAAHCPRAARTDVRRQGAAALAPPVARRYAGDMLRAHRAAGEARRDDPEACPEPVEGPRINLLVYHGVFAPHARYRPGAVRRAQEGARRHGSSPGGGGQAADAGTVATANGGGANTSQPASTSPPAAAPGSGNTPPTLATARPPPPGGSTRPKHYAWADLLQGRLPSMPSRARNAAGGCASWRRLPLDTAFGLLGVVGV
jgi:hypothetical protein